MSNAAKLEKSHQDNKSNIDKYLKESKIPKEEREKKRGGLKSKKEWLLEGAMLDMQLASPDKEYDHDDVQKSYSQAIERLQEARDAKQGIKWKKIKNADGSQTIIRDARALGQDDFPESESELSYGMNIINLCRGAEMLLEESPNIDEQDAKKIKNAIRRKAFQVVKDLKNGEVITSSDYKDASDFLVNQLLDAGLEDPQRSLTLAKSLVSMDDPPNHIATISTAKDSDDKERVVVEMEVVCLGTTDRLKQQYEEIAAGGGDNIDWFKDFPEEQKKVIRRYAPHLAMGDRILSSQLIDFLPGMKNAYEKTTLVNTEHNSHDLKEVARVFHSGSPSHHGKGNQVQATKDAIEQAKSFAGDELEVDFSLHSLNSDGQRVPGALERGIVRNLKGALKAVKGVALDIAPINFFRSISSSSHEFSKESLKKFAEQLRKKEPSKDSALAKQAAVIVADYIEKGEQVPWYVRIFPFVESDRKKAKQALQVLHMTDRDVAEFADKGFNLRSSIEKAGNIFRHNNFHITGDAASVDHAIADETSPTREPNQPKKRKRLYFCKSGKDRTGVAMWKISHVAVCNALGFGNRLLARTTDSEKEILARTKENLKRLTSAGNAQYVAGVAGAAIGGHGVKSEIILVLDSSTKSAAKGVIHRTSHHNKVVVGKHTKRLVKERRDSPKDKSVGRKK